MYLKPHQRVIRTLGVFVYLLVLGVVWEGNLKEGASLGVWLSYGLCVVLFCGAQAFLWFYEAVTGFDGAESIYLKYASRALQHTNLLLQQGRTEIRPNLKDSLTRLFALSLSVSENCLSRIRGLLKGVWAGGDRLATVRLTGNRG